MKQVAWSKSRRPKSKPIFYKNLLIMMAIAVLGIAMVPVTGQAVSRVPLNASGIYSATADDGSKIFLYRYAPYLSLIHI